MTFRPLVTLLWFALCLLLGLPLATNASAADPRTDGGMVQWPQGEMARALDIIVPERMAAMRVPGAAMAIVKNGRPVYIGHFGITDRRHDDLIQSDTMFEAGALGEVVTTYAAATMMRDKLLFIDAPLSRDLTRRWIDNQREDAAVTLRLVLSHMSGLGDNAIHPSGQVRYAPGTRFSHSGEGYVYLQHVMETVAGNSFEDLMRSRVFVPLGMTHSSFIAIGPGKARGHVPLSTPLRAFYFPFFAGFIGTLVLTVAVLRFVYDEHRPKLNHMVFPVLGAVVAAVAAVWLNLGFAMMVLVSLIAIFFAVLVSLIAFLIDAALNFMGLGRGREGILMRGQSGGSGRVYVIVMALTALAALPLLHMTLPVICFPFGKTQAPNAALTFQTAADDMSRFMIEMLDGDKIGKSMTGQLFSQQVRIGRDQGWALGLGLKRDHNRITYWERGSTLGSESLMVLEPARNTGLVVLTNSSEGAALAQELARNIFGIETVWSLP